MNGRLRLLFILTAVAVAVRLVALSFLHPLNWDEVEYFRATDWVRQGLVPFRDFWEHHTPLLWFVFAPVTALTSSPGADAILLMRWAQVPLWIAAFWLMNRLMQRAGIDAVPRWTAIVLALTSSLLMISAVEYRVDVLANALYLAGLVLLLRPLTARTALVAGALFCFAGLANLRLGPLLAVTAILYCVVDTRDRRWRVSVKAAIWLFAGVAAVTAMALVYFVATDSLAPLYQHVWVENYIGERYAERVPLAFVHRILIPFGIRIYGGGPSIQWTGIDFAGALILILGFAGVFRALRAWRHPDPLFFIALLQIANVAFVAAMKFVYHYHLQIVVLLMIPFAASLAARLAESLAARRALITAVVIAGVLNVPIVLLRGKELELQYQDLIMREVHARTAAGARIFDGVGWAIRREPAYRFWFLPVLVRQLVANGHAPPYTLKSWLADPPDAVITDRNAVVWLAMHRELGSYVVRHYLPVWRNLLMPGLSGILESGGSASWIVPATGHYRVVAAPQLAMHPWFRHPFRQAPGWEISVAPTGAERLRWNVDGREVAPQPVIALRRGSRVTVQSISDEAVGVFLVPGDERLWFRQPPSNVTIDAEGPREWHWPVLSAPIPTSSARP